MGTNEELAVDRLSVARAADRRTQRQVLRQRVNERGASRHIRYRLLQALAFGIRLDQHLGPEVRPCSTGLPFRGRSRVGVTSGSGCWWTAAGCRFHCTQVIGSAVATMAPRAALCVKSGNGERAWHRGVLGGQASQTTNIARATSRTSDLPDGQAGTLAWLPGPPPKPKRSEPSGRIKSSGGASTGRRLAGSPSPSGRQARRTFSGCCRLPAPPRALEHGRRVGCEAVPTGGEPVSASGGRRPGTISSQEDILNYLL